MQIFPWMTVKSATCEFLEGDELCHGLKLLHHGGVAGEVARQDLRELGPHLLN